MGEYIDSRDLLKARVHEFLERYGDKGFIVLKTAIEVSLSSYNGRRYGDFDYRGLVFRLRSHGVEYNPSNLLRVLERDYGIIEKSYSSSNQKWYRFIDLEGVREALYEHSGSISDPRIRVLKIKFNSLEPYNLLKRLKQLASKHVLSVHDREFVKKIAFSELDKICELIEQMSVYEEYFREEIMVLNEVIEYASIVSNKIGRVNKGVSKEVVREAYVGSRE